MHAGIELLRTELESQIEILSNVETAEEKAIEVGKAAQRRVDAQRDHVEQLRSSLAALELSFGPKEIEVQA